MLRNRRKQRTPTRILQLWRQKSVNIKFSRYFQIVLCLTFCSQLVAAPGAVYAGSFFNEPESKAIPSKASVDSWKKNAGLPTNGLVQKRSVTINIEKKIPLIKPKENQAAAEAMAPSEVSEPEDFAEMEEDFLKDPFAEETPEYPPIADPLESFNRAMFNFNDKVFVYIFRPIATAYKKVVHEEIRLSIKNVFANALSPVKLFSSMIQGDLDKSVRVLGRLVINTTVGLGGLFDVAKYYDIESVNENFDQALGYHGVPTGPYIVLPIFGPSSGRSALSSVVDALLNPLVFVSPTFLIGSGITTGKLVNDTSFNIDAYDDLKDSAIDPYISIRDFNHQYREGLVNK